MRRPCWSHGAPRRKALDSAGSVWYIYTSIMARRHETISGVLRRAIVDSGVPYLTLEQATGVNRQSIARFVAGENSLRLDKADRLATYLGIRVHRAKGAT